MENRRGDKTIEIERYLEELEKLLPENFEGYQKDFKTKAACERYFEKIVESVLDLAFLIIKEKELKIPESGKEAFDILSNEKIISEELSEKLKNAKGMRNILAHEYGKVDDEVVFQAITEELIKDTNKFLEVVR